MTLQQIKGVGEVVEKKLHTLGIFDSKTLIERLPRTYIDLSKVTPFQDAFDGSYCLIDIIITAKSQPFMGKKVKIFTAVGECENTSIKLNWYNNPYASKTLEIGQVYTFYGKIKFNNYSYEMNNPSFERKSEITKFSGIQPIYQTKGIIFQRTYWGLVKDALSKECYSSVINEENEQKYGLMSLQEAYNTLHIPINMELKKAKERIALEKIVRRLGAFQLAQKKNTKNKIKLANIDFSPLKNILTFTLNSSQKDAIESIKNTLLSEKKLNAILCGDVGSGKTVVAIIASFFVIKNGLQTAFMAPTEILARQHYEKITALFAPLGICCDIVTGSLTLAEKKALYARLKNGEIDILVGTHSLINDSVIFKNLGLIVADEQHRFGVAQRTKLINKAKNCAVLTLSATPIPRSMQLIAYGEVQYLNIERRFVGNVATKMVTKEKRSAMWQYIIEYCKKGGQAFVVAPKIFDSEGIESETVIALHKEIASYASDIKIGLLHGKLKAETKQNLINNFATKKIKILVSTTVIEVGIDVPDAGIMVIMDAEKFGLATLHQLRGRIGRNGENAYCFLYTTKKDSQNLAVMTSCNDGFALAEADFDTRGCGELLGIEQSGSSSLGCLTLSLLKKAKKIADNIDFESYRGDLDQEIADFSLDSVTLN